MCRLNSPKYLFNKDRLQNKQELRATINKKRKKDEITASKCLVFLCFDLINFI